MTDLHAGSGIAGLDQVLKGGWPRDRLHLVVGQPGSGKTTLGFQFLLAGIERGEKALYISLSETADEIRAVAASHGWSLDGIELFELVAAHGVLGLENEQTMFDPSDVEFRETSRAVLGELERVRPRRVVFDSLSELALLARDPLAFRRELLTLKRVIMERGATALLMSDTTDELVDRHLHSLAHGVLEVEELSPLYGPARRRLRMRKLRGQDYVAGYHDFVIRQGGLQVFPRLVAAEERESDTQVREFLASGVPELDEMLGGGIARGGSTLFVGPSGSGKSSLISILASGAVKTGLPAAIFLFDEERDTFIGRSEALGHPMREHLEAGLLTLHKIDPAELSPGEFTHRVRHAVEEKGALFVGLDSLNGYIYAMPEERFLTLQVHELLAYLARRNVATALVLTQSGMVGEMSTPADLTYIADSVVLLRYFEAHGEVRRAVSMLKKRSGAHGGAIRELRFGPGLQVGEPLHEFDGILSGVPRYVGDREALFESREGGGRAQ